VVYQRKVVVVSGGTQVDNFPVLAREGNEWSGCSKGKKKKTFIE